MKSTTSPTLKLPEAVVPVPLPVLPPLVEPEAVALLLYLGTPYPRIYRPLTVIVRRFTLSE